MGNGSPDLFSAFSAISHGSSGLGFGGLIGGGVFVTVVVLAAISLSSSVTNVTNRSRLLPDHFRLRGDLSSETFYSISLLSSPSL